MPIVGLTRRDDVTPQFPILGKLRKGGAKTDPKRPGPDLEYWRFTSERPEVERAFYTAYGAQPATVEGYLPYATMEANWGTWYEEHEAGGMVHRCDGRTMYRWRKADGSYEDGERACPYFSGARERTKEHPGCKQVGRLSIIIPQLVRAGFIGFVTMETHSINDLVSITSSLLDIEQRAGRLNGVLMSLLRVPQTISTPAWSEQDKAAGKRSRTKKWLVKVVPAVEWVQAQLARQHDEAMALASGTQLALPQTATGYVDEDEEDLDDDTDGEIEDTDEHEEGDFRALLEAEKPTPAEAVVLRLRTEGSQDSRPVDEATLKRAWGQISALTGDKSRQKELLKRVFETDTSRHMTMGQAAALIKWIAAKPQTLDPDTGKGKDYIPTGPATTAGEYSLLFPPEAGLFEEGAA